MQNNPVEESKATSVLVLNVGEDQVDADQGSSLPSIERVDTENEPKIAATLVIWFLKIFQLEDHKDREKFLKSEECSQFEQVLVVS